MIQGDFFFRFPSYAQNSLKQQKKKI